MQSHFYGTLRLVAGQEVKVSTVPQGCIGMVDQATVFYFVGGSTCSRDYIVTEGAQSVILRRASRK